MLNVFTQLTPGTTLLTPNRRLAAVLLKNYHRWQTINGQACWDTPDILPFSTWLQRLWNDYVNQEIHAHPLLLNSAQEYALWEQILSLSRANEYLLQVAETADTVQAAWGLVKQWQLDLDHPSFRSSEDYLAFQQWAKQFQTLCHEQRWLDQASLPQVILSKIAKKIIKPPGHILLLGFTELPPLHQALLDECKLAGSAVAHLHKETLQTASLATTEPQLRRLSLSDQEAEIRSMARWSKAITMQHALAETPAPTIGCIIPTLPQHRETAARIFSEVYASEDHYTSPPETAPFNISAGKNLSQYPIVYTALELLKLANNTISLENFSHILRSPFLVGAEKEMLARAQFENVLRQHNVTHLSLKDMLNKDRFSLKHYCPLLAKRLTTYFSLLENTNITNTASRWGELFTQLLNQLGWPGERSVNSQEYQVMQAWLECISTYMTLDHVLIEQNYKSALHYLVQTTHRSIFQPQSPDTPVQILGILEAIDLPFDYVWVMGLDDQTWPPAPKPNAFIPKQLQKKLHLPHATAEREFLYCQQLTQKLKHAAPHVVFSHALKNAEIDLRNSALIEDIVNVELTDLTLANYIPVAQRIHISQTLENYLDNQGPAVATEEKIRGGVSILKQQAACPFKAFAELRLHANALESPTPGLPPQERGSIVHKALELIWKSLVDYHSLISLSDNDLSNLIQEHVTTAMAQITHQHNQQSRYLNLESQRAQKLLWEWLKLEKTRAPFKVIATEQEQQIQLGTIKFTLRVDRIDEISDGKQFIIDYKTGKMQTIHDWFGDRPDEPQLPVYCLINPTDTIGIAFAQVYPGDLQFKGVSKVSLEMKSVKTLPEVSASSTTLWEQQLIEWKAVLTKLSENFYQGQAAVDPKNMAQVCRLCKLQSLCRIHTSIR